MKEYILCAALIYNGNIVSGHRHNDCYLLLQTLLNKKDSDGLPGRDAQGFLTSCNRFVNRKDGYKIAKAQSQLLIPPHKDEDDSQQILTSEDLY